MATTRDIELHTDELEDARWFTRDELRAAEAVRLPVGDLDRTPSHRRLARLGRGDYSVHSRWSVRRPAMPIQTSGKPRRPAVEALGLSVIIINPSVP